MSYSDAVVLRLAEQTSVSQQLNTGEAWPPNARMEAAEAARGFARAVAAHSHCPTGPDNVRRHAPVRLHDVLEKEVKRMAQSLHDEAGQLLAAVHLKLDEVHGSLPPGQRDSVRQLKSMLDHLEAELRRLSHELRPMILDDLGLLPAVEFLKQGIARRSGLSIEVKGSTAGRLPARIETALYRVVHEALGSIASHARARRVSIAFLKDATRVQCSVRDDGVGFDAGEVLAAHSGRSLSLAAIRERVEDLSGTVSLSCGPNQGTELLISIPLDELS